MIAVPVLCGTFALLRVWVMVFCIATTYPMRECADGLPD